jgi:hypothetical protein
MLIDCSTLNLKSFGTKSFKSTPQRTGYTVLLDDVANGSSPEIYIQKVGRSMANAADAKRKSAVYAMGSGTAIRTVLKMMRQMHSWKPRRRPVGSDATAAEPW